MQFFAKPLAHSAELPRTRALSHLLEDDGGLACFLVIDFAHGFDDCMLSIALILVERETQRCAADACIDSSSGFNTRQTLLATILWPSAVG
jgi:hypothetical protein